MEIKNSDTGKSQNISIENNHGEIEKDSSIKQEDEVEKLEDIELNGINQNDDKDHVEANPKLEVNIEEIKKKIEDLSIQLEKYISVCK